ncbi:MAG: AI-2E family transporter [Nevskiales bacterium]|nr:AI-2E family transporter [Nevskiales bacterium]
MSWSAKAAWLVLGALLVLLYFLSPILTPFVLSAGLAYLGNPWVNRLVQYKLSRTAAVSVVFVLLSLIGLAVLALLLPLLQQQLAAFVAALPQVLGWIQTTGLPALGITLPQGLHFDAAELGRLLTEHGRAAGGLAIKWLGSIARSGGALLGFMATLLLVPVVTFYLLRDWDRLLHRMDELIPHRFQDRVRRMARETDEVLSAFLRGQLLVMTMLGLFYSAGLWLIGLQLALLIGLGAGLVSFVPYLGFIAGLLAAGIAMLVQTHAVGLPLLYVALVFGAGQMLESMVLTPWLVGNRIGLHPVAVIFAVLAGGQLFGFIGVLLALPTAAVLAVLLRHAKTLWLTSPAYRER